MLQETNANLFTMPHGAFERFLLKNPAVTQKPEFRILGLKGKQKFVIKVSDIVKSYKGPEHTCKECAVVRTVSIEERCLDPGEDEHMPKIKCYVHAKGLVDVFVGCIDAMCGTAYDDITKKVSQ